MKNIFVLLCLILGYAPLSAQDLIVTSEGDSLNCKITNLKKDYIYFTFKHKDEIRNTLLSLGQIADYRYNFYSTPMVPAAKIKPTIEYQQFSAAIKTGWGYRTAPVADNVPRELNEYIKGLKSGFVFGLDFQYYFSEPLGIGFKYSTFRSSNSIDNIQVTMPNGTSARGKMSDDILISYAGPSFNVRLFNADKKGAFLTNAGFGYLAYRDKALLINNFTLEGSTFGFTCGLGYDLMLSRNTALEFQASIIGGILSSYKMINGTSTQTIKLEKENLDNLSRIELTAGFKFLK